jgi:hypothetical protein
MITHFGLFVQFHLLILIDYHLNSILKLKIHNYNIGLAINLSDFRQLTLFGVFRCFLTFFGVF